MSDTEAARWLQRIRELELPARIRIMNVCGGHERAITMAGLRSALPGNIELIPGPGCPVCICPEEDIFEAIQISLNEDLTLVSFGDMLRVPVNAPKSEARSLEQARAAGADIRPVASPLEVIRIARENPDREVLFFAAGFETTMAPVAAMALQNPPENLSILLSGRLTWPAVSMLLDTGQANFDCLVAPGHVSTIMGSNEWQFVVRDHQIPTAVAGFTGASLLAAFYSTIRQKLEHKLFLDNCYPELVHEEGNRLARRQLADVFDVVDANWRGVGSIPASGYALNAAHSHLDARPRFPGYRDDARKRAGEMPPGCDCARVVLGQIYPDECRLYGSACKPRTPVGPCMVSDEGACRIWWSGGVRKARTAA
ncbi:MAG: hydrogenase formation protein HypD [Pseudomonadota bacterium]